MWWNIIAKHVDEVEKNTNKRMNLNKIKADVDDELYLLKKRIQFKYKLSWAKARNAVNKSIKELYETK